MQRSFEALLMGTAVSLVSALAVAHVSVISGPGFANTSQEITFAVGHGCAGADTFSVRVQIPAGVTSVRTAANDFGKVTVEKDSAGLVTAVSWQKTVEQVLDSDSAYYKVTLRLRVPDQPFSTLHFPARQTCRASDGTTTVVDWSSTLPEAPDGGGPEPAPELKILPARRAGWNKFTVPVAVADLGVFFGDALIVWKGNAAYSANANTVDLIAGTPGVTKLANLAANDQIWVKY